MIILVMACLCLFLVILTRINHLIRHTKERFEYLENLIKKDRAGYGQIPEPKTNTPLSDIPSFVKEEIEPEPLYIPPPKVETIFEGIPEPEPVFVQEVYKAAPRPRTPEADSYRPSWWENFKTRNPDLEKFIGENLISKIGIAVLVLGIAFFVKFAIDKNWINEIARVGIGILCGALVNFIAHRLREKFKAFSSVLVAGAIAIYYFTIAIGFQEYHIFSQGVAFALMIVITAFSFVVSLSYNREELALLSLIGGFATPLMVSTGAGNYVVLFTYLLILDTGILALAFVRKWNRVNVCTFVFTILFYLGWFQSKVYNVPHAPFGGAFTFAALFYIIFTLTILVNDARKRRPAGDLELCIFLANTALFYAIGMYIMHTAFPRYTGVFTASLAIVNMAIGWLLYKRFNADKKLVYLLVGLALTFVTLAAPVQLDGNHITLFWAAESVLLLWLSLKSELRNFLLSSMIVSVLMICSLLIDWFQYYTGIVTAELPIVFNSLFLTGCFACACMFVKVMLLKKHPASMKWLSINIDPAAYRNLLNATAVIILYFVCQIELNYQLVKIGIPDISANIILGAYHMLFFTVLTLYFYYKKSIIPAFITALVNMLVYAVILSSMHFFEIETALTNSYTDIVGYKLHFVSLACVIVMMYYLFRILVDHAEKAEINSKLVTYIFCTVVVSVCSVELMMSICSFKLDDFIQMTNAYSARQDLRHLQIQVAKTGFPILWGILSILFLVYGIRHGNRETRIFSLVLQAITILKLFIFDITNVSEGGKIAAFILLGVVLLIMSFMYQKIKAIIFNDENKPE